ncbi:MAG: primase [Candidatus Parcubacteria bacterium]|jgi:DNA primase
MDVIALFDAGLPIGVATCGTALTPQHAKLLKRHTDKITFSFDTDNAGFEATIRGLKVAYEAELYPSVLILPAGYKDIDEYVHSNEPYQTYLLDPNSRQDGFLFLISKLLQQYDYKNPVERKKVQNICFDVLVALQDYSIMMMYIEQLAFKLGTNQDSLFQQFKVYLKQKPKFGAESGRSKIESNKQTGQ